MRALSLTQPWASLVAVGAKRTETRSWRTSYRGLLAIHASKQFLAVNRRLAMQEPFIGFLRENRAGQFYPWEVVDQLPLGAIAAVADLVDCVSTYAVKVGRGSVPNPGLTLSDQERAFGDYSPGRFAWMLTKVRRLQTPIPCKGALRLWELPAEVERQVREQIGEVDP